tara:strand:- start:3601 stop:3705 length:105 start_codon:yes stop_codon:yes gene_type:complete
MAANRIPFGGAVFNHVIGRWIKVRHATMVFIRKY